jgi:hypothetical protein
MKRPPRKLETSILLAALTAFIILGFAPFAGQWLREPVAARAGPLPLSFPHSKHLSEGILCTKCHHNYKDRLKATTAGVPCIHCHKGNHPDLKRGIEGEFHDLCKGCHAEQARTLAKHGPVRECVGCHVGTTDGYMP